MTTEIEIEKKKFARIKVLFKSMKEIIKGQLPIGAKIEKILYLAKLMVQVNEDKDFQEQQINGEDSHNEKD